MNVPKVALCVTVCLLVAALQATAALAGWGSSSVAARRLSARAHPAAKKQRRQVWTLAQLTNGKLHKLKAGTAFTAHAYADFRLHEEKENSAGYKYDWSRHLVCLDSQLSGVVKTNGVAEPEISLEGFNGVLGTACVEEGRSHVEWREGYFEAWGTASVNLLYLPWTVRLETTEYASLESSRYFEIEVHVLGVTCKYWYLPNPVRANVTSPQSDEYGVLRLDLGFRLAQLNKAAGCPPDGVDFYISLSGVVNEGGPIFAKLE